MFFEIEQKHAQRKYGLIVASITAADGGFVFSRTAKASNDEASHECRRRIRPEFDRLGRTAILIEPSPLRNIRFSPQNSPNSKTNATCCACLFLHPHPYFHISPD